MPILYSVISRGQTVLAKYASCAGNFAEVTEQIIAKIPPRDEKLTYSHGNYLFHYISSDGIIYMCITDDVSIRKKSSKSSPNATGISGIRTFTSIPLPKWGQTALPSLVWQRSRNGHRLRNEPGVFQGFGQWNEVLLRITRCRHHIQSAWGTRWTQEYNG